MDDRLGIIGAIGFFFKSEDPLFLGWSGRSDVHADPAGQDDVPRNLLPHAGPRGGGCKYHPGITSPDLILIFFAECSANLMFDQSLFCHGCTQ